jgi:hypothetical protein
LFLILQAGEYLMTEVSAKKQVWRGLRFSARSIWMLFLATSLIANVALGITNFVLQPLWRAAAVLSATAAVFDGTIKLGEPPTLGS